MGSNGGGAAWGTARVVGVGTRAVVPVRCRLGDRVGQGPTLRCSCALGDGEEPRLTILQARTRCVPCREGWRMRSQKRTLHGIFIALVVALAAAGWQPQSVVKRSFGDGDSDGYVRYERPLQRKPSPSPADLRLPHRIVRASTRSCPNICTDTRSAMKKICRGTWIIYTTIPSSMGWCRHEISVL